MAASVRNQLSEVAKPWYPSADDHANAVSNYLRGDTVTGWEPREEVANRIAEAIGGLWILGGTCSW